jgi:hypothetical protein
LRVEGVCSLSEAVRGEEARTLKGGAGERPRRHGVRAAAAGGAGRSPRPATSPSPRTRKNVESRSLRVLP